VYAVDWLSACKTTQQNTAVHSSKSGRLRGAQRFGADDLDPVYLEVPRDFQLRWVTPMTDRLVSLLHYTELLRYR